MSKIEIINGYKEYIKNKEKIIVLNNINIKFEEGKTYAIMGNSGSGKTTLLNILGTLDVLTSGKMLIDNDEILKLKDDEKAYFEIVIPKELSKEVDHDVQIIFATMMCGIGDLSEEYSDFIELEVQNVY